CFLGEADIELRRVYVPPFVDCIHRIGCAHFRSDPGLARVDTILASCSKGRGPRVYPLARKHFRHRFVRLLRACFTTRWTGLLTLTCGNTMAAPRGAHAIRNGIISGDDARLRAPASVPNPSSHGRERRALATFVGCLDVADCVGPATREN